MDLSKNAINGFGAAAAAVIVIAGGMFIAKPQFSSASDFRDKASEVSASKSTQQIKLNLLKSQQENLPQLEEEMETAKAEIPDDEDIASVGREVVEALDDTVTLRSFSHQKMIPWQPLAEPFATLGEIEPPFEVDDATGAPAAPPTEASGPPVLQAIPLIIELSGKGVNDFAAYADRLSKSDRLILVAVLEAQEPNSASGEAASATIYAFAFANAPAAAPPTGTEAPASE